MSLAVELEEGERWYVAKSRWHSEQRAEENLKACGYKAFSPMYLAKAVASFRGLTDVWRPLFSGYLFVAFDRDGAIWQRITSTIGVHSLIMTSAGQPIPVKHGAVEALLERSPDGKFTDPAYAEAAVQPFIEGEYLQVLYGPFRGRRGRFIGATERRVMIIFYLLGAEREIILPIASVARA